MTYEVLRRAVLVLGLGAAAWLSRLTASEPFVAVYDPQFAQAQEGSRRPAPDGRTEEELSREEFIAYRIGGRIIEVSGPEWAAFFDRVLGALDKGAVPPGWERRAAAKDFRRLYFWASEPPLSGVSARFGEQIDYYLRLGGAQPRYLEAYCYPRLKSSGLGSGFYGIPRSFAYPRLGLVPWILSLTLAIYILLPWPKRASNVSALARWRVAGADWASALLLFGFFFALPLFIVGSSRQAATEWLFFSLFFWGLASLGLLSEYWGAVWGCFSVTVLEDRLQIGHLRGSVSLAYRDLESVQPASFRPPAWLVRILLLLTLMGGRRGLLAAGQAALMASSEAKGYLLKAKDGRRAYIWYTDPMGNTALTNFGVVEKALRASGARTEDVVLELKGIFPPLA